jgi:hypothetical protein
MNGLMEYIFVNYKVHTYCHWSLGLKVTVSYVRNTTLIKRLKRNVPGIFIKILEFFFYLNKKYYF